MLGFFTPDQVLFFTWNFIFATLYHFCCVKEAAVKIFAFLCGLAGRSRGYFRACRPPQAAYMAALFSQRLKLKSSESMVEFY